MTGVLSCKILLILLIIPIGIAIFIQRILFAGIEVPPPTYGTGSMFDTIAMKYDTINRILALGMDIKWRQEMVNVIKDSLVNIQQQPIMILDLATGTADVAIQLGQNIPNAHIIGIDPSQNMLSIGKQKIKKYNLNHRIDLQYADAQELISHFTTAATTTSHDDVDDDDNNKQKIQLFHAATMSFGIRNVLDRKKALCEINHLLYDQSKFCILEFSEPDVSIFGIMGMGAKFFIRYVVPIIGGILSGSPREYWHLQQSINDFPSPTEFIQLLESLECPTSSTMGGGIGRFIVNELKQLNFGSVQLYVTTKISTTPTTTIPERATETETISETETTTSTGNEETNISTDDNEEETITEK